MKKPRRGQIFRYWWVPDGTPILAVRPYRGRYTQWFSWEVKLAVPPERVYRKTERWVIYG